MGNSGSSRQEAAARQQHPSKYHQHKVLLDLDNAPRLRPTHNGAILHGGGTISQRKLQSYGSEPDLRYSGAQKEESQTSKLRISRNNRKKYRAPPAPQADYYNDWDGGGGRPSRRLRLFVTRAEAKRKSHEHSINDEVDSRQAALPPPSGRLRRSLSTPQFQQELARHYEDEPPPRPPPPDVGRPPRIPTSQRSEPEVVGNSFLEELREKQLLRENRFKSQQQQHQFPQHPQQEQKKEELTQRQKDEEWLANTKTPVPVKTFYFGMDEPVDDPFGFDSFVPKTRPSNSYTSSESQLSEGFQDYDENGSGISVHLRATLPRRQVDIPRFSPAAAWRQLIGATETQSLPSPVPPLEEEVIESRIHAPPPIQIPAALLPDKSADSGISGDASPQQFDSAAWTPQQDLEETSSDGFPTDFMLRDQRYTPRLAISLPKEPESDRPSPFLDQTPFLPFVKPFPDLDNNWMLSCSIPSSVNYPSGGGEDDPPAPLVKKPSFNYLTAGGHIMYLPEYSAMGTNRLQEDTRQQLMSKSCEDLATPPPAHETNKYKPKKFTFQSTIRQQERKAIAEKLARIAEHTELKRRSEQEAMRRVEEEFQKKREREKADIRQQLRLFNISNKAQLASLESSMSNP